MEGIRYFCENNIEGPDRAERLGALGFGSLATLIAAHYLPRPLVGSAAVVTGAAMAALGSRQHDQPANPTVACGIGLVATAALVSIATRQVSVPAIAMRMTTVGLSGYLLWNGWQANSVDDATNRWTNTCLETAIFAVPATMNLFLAYLEVSPAVTTLALPLVVWGAAYHRTQFSREPWPAPLIIGGAATSALLAPLRLATLWQNPIWNWSDRGNALLFVLTTAGASALVGREVLPS